MEPLGEQTSLKHHSVLYAGVPNMFFQPIPIANNYLLLMVLRY